MFSLKYVACITGGIAFGFLVSMYWSDSGKDAADRDYSTVNERQEEKYLISENELRVIVSDVVRKELSAQLQHHEKIEDAQGVEEKLAEGGKDQPANLQATKVEESYKDAAKVLDDVVAMGGFDAYSAKNFIEQLNTLPQHKAMELRARHMDAVNKGLVSSPYPPEVFLQLDQLPGS